MSEQQNKPRWMKIHSGLLEPKHRETLGVRVWLFMYMIDQVDWTTGMIDKWTDGNAAAALEMPKATVRTQRYGLQEDGYITSYQTFQALRIVIHKWRDPRLVSAEQRNVKGVIESDHLDERVIESDHPSIDESDHPSIGSDSKHNTSAKTAPDTDTSPSKKKAQPLEGPPANGETPHTAMKNAILDAFGWQAEDVTVWGDIDRASKLLRKVDFSPDEVPALYRYCASQFDKFGPVCLPKYVPGFRKDGAPKDRRMVINADGVKVPYSEAIK